jgi:hypothetical protein
VLPAVVTNLAGTRASTPDRYLVLPVARFLVFLFKKRHVVYQASTKLYSDAWRDWTRLWEKDCHLAKAAVAAMHTYMRNASTGKLHDAGAHEVCSGGEADGLPLN